MCDMRVRDTPVIARAFIMNKSAQSGGVAYRFRALFAILDLPKRLNAQLTLKEV